MRSVIGIVSHVGAEEGRDFRGIQTVVFDILRATTTMAVAFEGGVREIIPAASIDTARRLKEEFPSAILGGERNLEPPPGFEYGNSPAQYSKARLEGRSLILATTNGTKALHAAARSGLLLAASFRNLAATVARLDPNLPIVLFAAGVEGRDAEEDLLAAGAIAASMIGRGADATPEVEEAVSLWRRCADIGASIAATPNGERLIAGGHGDDVVMAAEMDTCPIAIHVEGGRAIPAQ